MAALNEQPPLKICEFYSGIGGWRYALEKATSREDHDVALAVDASTTCNSIYEHNFGQRPTQRRVENITTSDVAGADGWLLSPPCQPYTRQHAMTDVSDPRAASLLHLADLVEQAPPRFVCLENVVGFASSESRERWHGALRRAGFARPKCWHLTPTQTGVPHERPRYFECAVRTNSDEDWASPAPTEDAWPGLDRTPPMRLVKEFLEAPYALDQCADASALIEPYRVPAKTIKSDAAWCFDVVDATDAIPTACFTRSYGRFNRGTGSVLRVRQMLNDPDLASLGFSRTTPDARPFGDTWRAALQLRYFAPKEVANLLGFPQSFHFPADVSLKSAWAAGGNSLHVDAAAAVIRVALDDLAAAEASG
ncbi:unnamed protein product [Pelagomonas calceolata]|uniref:DNA (cytosine-5-)-methyltransferase n=1 Tax=Pelagomonas calceolata TaxID=35677 RepID=A0A8J2SP26_9STRA|nr:unnamed protein product [Pelagomonas calceolata]